MYAIVEIQGQQFRAEAGKKLYVNRLQAEAGQTLEFDKVLLVDNEGAVKVGAPTVEGAKVTAEVVADVRGEKVLVFHKKRRKGYKKLNGFRADLTQILIKEIAG
ncbi:MAG: 50S ribosomal protein L21 [Paludibacteraceae bacterium]|nr:50S ribosomal protein L21 [Paludibacteraceae bacterium]